MQDKISVIKRNCLLCQGYRFLHKGTNEYKGKVIDALNELYDKYRYAYESARKDDTPSEKMEKLRENRALCQDMIATCQKCDREIDRVNRMLPRLSG
jgi:predicted transcriptional regulator